MEDCSPLLVKITGPHGIEPRRGSALAAGYDLSSSAHCVIPARGRFLVPLSISMAIPRGYYGRIAPRSGLASKHGIDVGAGVVDADYRGELFALLFNHSDEDFTVNRGDRVAQLVIERIATPEVRLVLDHDETERGAGGFGSTGVAAKLV